MTRMAHPRSAMHSRRNVEVHVAIGLCTPAPLVGSKKNEMSNERNSETLRMSSVILVFGFAILGLLELLDLANEVGDRL
jgi:hypothetical protein